MEDMVVDLSFWKGKRVFLTGHTGFKGSWLSRILINAGAELVGYALEPQPRESLFTLCEVETDMHSIIGDIRDLDKLKKAYVECKPDIVIHMAAQPLVWESYENPVYTYETNVLGTVNLLECLRLHQNARSFLNITTDKVYENHEWIWGYRETDALNGYDPYSNSKSCSELVTHSYKNSFFSDNSVSISTARAGNVIGGGDFSANRIVPDCVRYAMAGKDINVRNPNSIRPYQHVLEPLFAYLLILEEQYSNGEKAGCYNIGPDDSDCITTGELVGVFCQNWGQGLGWYSEATNGPHEANYLKLDCSKMKSVFGWRPKWSIQTAIAKTIEWTLEYMATKNISALMDEQIVDYLR